jgi:hypothetical protein
MHLDGRLPAPMLQECHFLSSGVDTTTHCLAVQSNWKDQLFPPCLLGKPPGNAVPACRHPNLSVTAVGARRALLLGAQVRLTEPLEQQHDIEPRLSVYTATHAVTSSQRLLAASIALALPSLSTSSCAIPYNFVRIPHRQLIQPRHAA